MGYIDEFTDFIFLQDELEESDIIFIPGSGEEALPVRAAGLWKEGLAPIVLPSGRYSKLVGRFTKDGAYRTEWEYFCHILLENGVPKPAIWREDTATFTYENALRSREVTDCAGLMVRRAILCCQAVHARRAKLYYQVCFPEAELLVSPVECRGIGRESWFLIEEGIQAVLSEVERCGSQFGEILREDMRRRQKNR